jgi:hypothetical protein
VVFKCGVVALTGVCPTKSSHLLQLIGCIATFSSQPTCAEWKKRASPSPSPASASWSCFRAVRFPEPSSVLHRQENRQEFPSVPLARHIRCSVTSSVDHIVVLNFPFDDCERNGLSARSLSASSSALLLACGRIVLPTEKPVAFL